MATFSQQQAEAPRYNHPCEDLLDRGKRREYVNICVPLYRASIKGDLEAVRAILCDHEHLVRYSISENKETPLHIAATTQSTKLVRYLVDLMSEDDLKLQNEEGNTAFCIAAISGNYTMVMIMLQKNRQLLTIRGRGNMMPLYLALIHDQHFMVHRLFDHSQQMTSDGWTNDDRNRVFLKCIEFDHFDVAKRILYDNEDVNLHQNMDVREVLHLLARKRNAFSEDVNLHQYVPEVRQLLARMRNAFSGNQQDFIDIILHPFIGLDQTNDSADTQILRKIWKIVVQKPKDEINVILRGPMINIDGQDTHPYHILFVAVKEGNTKFVVELIREYPDLIWMKNDDGQTIFHVAAFHHCQGVYNLLHEIGSMKDAVTQLIDKNGNTMLHLVAMNTGDLHSKVAGVAFQLQRQLAWFRDVKVMVPRSFTKLKNAAGQTPSDIFSQNNKNRLSEGEKWIRETTNQCMVGATVVTTIGFSAAFTIPGGYDQNSGFPMFARNTPFKIFVILDAVSFILSSISTLIFLSMVLSRYSEDDFFYQIPRKLFLGVGTLYLSIITLMAAFSVSFFVLYHNKLPIFISLFATVPVILVAHVETQLLVDMSRLLRATDGSSNLSRPKKPMLYY